MLKYFLKKKRVKSHAKKKVIPHNLKGQVESITLNYGGKNVWFALAIMFMVVFTFIGVPYFPVL